MVSIMTIGHAMPLPGYRSSYKAEFRTAIVKAARELFVRLGYEGFSMRKLAKTLGCSHGNIYLYFKDKQQLFDFLVEDSFAQLLQALEHLRSERDAVQLLKNAGRVYVDFGRRNPDAYQFAFVLRRAGPARPWKLHPAFAFLRNAIRRCIEQKRFRAVDVDTATQAIWAAVHGITSLLISRPTFPWAPRDQLIDRVIDSAVDSLLSPAIAKNAHRRKIVRLRRPA